MNSGRLIAICVSAKSQMLQTEHESNLRSRGEWQKEWWTWADGRGG